MTCIPKLASALVTVVQMGVVPDAISVLLIARVSEMNKLPLAISHDVHTVFLVLSPAHKGLIELHLS